MCMQQHSVSVNDALNSILMFSTCVYYMVQKKLEIDSLAVSEHDNRQQLIEAGQQGKGKGAKEEKVGMQVYGKHFSQDCSCLQR